MPVEAQSGPVSECFVVMPFGKKPLPDGRTYDFDKVYRVIIQRAVQQAGMKALRADETAGSRLIHSDMFKDLRDRAVVLADLSLENPNVFYELGIRHVMAPSGTVLMCRKGTELPFDVRLSRVIFYKFEGDDLDWEEVEETIKTLKLALQDAQKKQPDSPVHVLLETVVRSEPSDLMWVDPLQSATAESLERYEGIVAEHWGERGATVDKLLSEYGDTVFGLRALAQFCLSGSTLPDNANHVAWRLQDAEQYGVANQIYRRLEAEGRLTTKDTLGYAGAYSEEHPDLQGATTAIGYVEAVLNKELQKAAEAAQAENTRQKKAKNSEQKPGKADGDAEQQSTIMLADAYRRLGGLLQWKWQLSRRDDDLNASIKAHQTALTYMNSARAHGKFPYPGLIAQTRLKLLIALRVRDNDPTRQDTEDHRDEILKINGRSNDRLVDLSYLHWYQAIALADLGAKDDANAKVLDQLAQDAKLMTKPECFEIGRREYVLLRRFLSHFGKYLHHPEISAQISRQLYMSLRKS
jgi:hypothetical protein